jgi:hypothetical protein
MPACNRRTFMTRIALGTVAFTAVGRALADPSAGTARPDSCGRCQFYSPASGGTSGTCAFSGKTVSVDGGCGEFAPISKSAST